MADTQPVSPKTEMPIETLKPIKSSKPEEPVTKPQASIKSINELIDALLTGSTSNERHQAIRGLAAQDWKKNPQIIAGLVKAARIDSDRAVRVNAIRHLAAMKADLPFVVDHLKYMQKDQDEWICDESTAALEKIAATK